MKVSFINGQIVADGYLHEDVPYDVSANNLSVCFDGKGSLSKYLSAKNGKNYSNQPFFVVYKDGERVGAYTQKRVTMAGRIQEIELLGEDYRLQMKQFIVAKDDAVFLDLTFHSETPTEFVVLYGVDGGLDWIIPASSCDNPYEVIAENMYFQLTCKVQGEKHIRFVFSYEETESYCEKLLAQFEEKLSGANKEINDVVFPASVQTEEEKALYLSALFCCLENYKEIDGLKGFVAGCNYLHPVRTYYRDSYWTVLPMYAYDISYVKRQVITLAHGIAEDGSCPSAVKQDFSAFWGGHYDSPSFFVMMAYDYVNHSGDKKLLSETVRGKTVFELCQMVTEKQMQRTDESGLLYKVGPYNKLDWADEVNRNGYVTYDDALYYRALTCMARLCEAVGVDGSRYEKAAETVKEAINRLLWDEEKGYYVNYVDGNFIEDNLSVDTVLVSFFGIASQERTQRMLDAMEKYLETKNNQLQKAGDYGVMCVYPFYKRIGAAYFKSAQDYYYHNGGNWPYWAALYAYAKYLNGREYQYPLESWFSYNLEKGIYTPVEYFSPCRRSGSTLQAWSGVAAFVFDFVGKPSFFERKHL